MNENIMLIKTRYKKKNQSLGYGTNCRTTKAFIQNTVRESIDLS